MIRFFQFATAAVVLVCWSARAGYFDCSVVYDEYESLMSNQFLVQPDRYVPTARQQISRTDYERLQKGLFKLHVERADRGVAVFRTNGNLYGKFLFHWEQPFPDQPPHVLIDYGVLYGRVSDGFSPVFFAPLRLKPGAVIDLDTGRAVDAEQETATTPDQPPRADLAYELNPDTGEPLLRAINDASVHFPIESMCHQPNKAPASRVRPPS